VATAVHWTARVLSVIVVLFFGFMIVAHFVGSEELPPRAATLVAIGVILIGLMVAWRWEAVGGVLVLGGYCFSALLNGQVLRAWPYALCLIAGLLFLVSWFMRRRPAKTVP